MQMVIGMPFVALSVWRHRWEVSSGAPFDTSPKGCQTGVGSNERANMKQDIWTIATGGPIREGSTVGAAGYTIQSVDPKGFTMLRPANKAGERKPVRVTRKMVEATLARLLAGEAIAYQGNRSTGGIDGTSAKRDGVLAALAGIAVRDGKLVTLASGARSRVKVA